MTLPLDPESLLHQREFMRALARSLLADEHRAEDVVQEACLVALDRPPRSEHALRPWLARVVRNLTSNALRGESRRADRELLGAREEGVPSAEEIAERVTIQREVGEALLAVGEAYRTALYLRFFEDLPPRAIAARLGVPVETVRSRLRRGLAAMRERLDREHGGDRRAWSVALLPLVIGPEQSAAWPTSATSARFVPRAVLVAAGMLAVGGGYWLFASRTPHAFTSIAAVPLARQVAAVVEPLRVPLVAKARQLVPASADSAEPLTGLVIDAYTREPVSGLTLTFTAADGAHHSVLSAPDGHFTTSAAFTRGRLLVEYADGGTRVPGRAAALLHDGEHEHALPVLIGPTLTLDAQLPPDRTWQDFACTLLEGGDAVEARPRVEPGSGRPWVRFARRPALSSLSGGTRSRMVLRLASEDGGWAGEAELAARPGVHATPIAIELRPCAPPVAFEPETGSVTGTLKSVTGAHVPAGSVSLRDGARFFSAEPFVTETGEHAFRFDGVPPGSYELVPPMDDGLPWEPRSVSVSVPAQGLVLTCRDDVAARELRIEAYDRESGEPLAETSACVLVDRYLLGKPAALDLAGAPRALPVAFGASATRVPEGAAVFWLVECPGYLSAQGDEHDLRSTPDGWLLRVRLSPAWRADLTVGHSESGTFTPLAGARLVTVGGSVLGTTDRDGRLYLELSYDPGRVRLELDGWRVRRWEGFRNGRLVEPGGPHAVWMSRE